MTCSRTLRHIFDIDSLPQVEIEAILNRAESFKEQQHPADLLSNRIAGLMFFQSSTRTRVGFDVAMKRLGGTSSLITETKYEPGMGWAESLEDTIRVVSAYCDVLIVRHQDTESLRRATMASSVPVINAGSGHEHHPTQALIDLFYIRSHFRRLEGLRIGFVGDLDGSRSTRSLIRAFTHWPPAELRLMAPSGRELPEALSGLFKISVISRADRLDASDLDVLYVSGLPNITGKDPYPESVRATFTVTPERVREMSDNGIVMCPLPRLDEIQPAVDFLPGAAYFSQSADGLFVRMAVLAYALL
jgi:aspartate carbamoyltransferase catalytic subunit